MARKERDDRNRPGNPPGAFPAPRRGREDEEAAEEPAPALPRTPGAAPGRTPGREQERQRNR